MRSARDSFGKARHGTYLLSIEKPGLTGTVLMVLLRGGRRVRYQALSAEDFFEVQENQELIFEPDEAFEVLVSEAGHGRRSRRNILV
jgi:hypothetical protein